MVSGFEGFYSFKDVKEKKHFTLKAAKDAIIKTGNSAHRENSTQRSKYGFGM